MTKRHHLCTSSVLAAGLLVACGEPSAPTPTDLDAAAPGVRGLPADGTVGHVRLRTHEGIRTVPYRMVGGKPMAADDIELEPEAVTTGSLYSAPAGEVQHWTNGIVPYEVESGFPQPERIQQAIDLFWRRSAIKLVPRTPLDSYYVRFESTTDDGLCGTSGIGRVPTRIITIADPTVRPDCQYGKVAHEIMHALGFWHEQSRPDRDNSIAVCWNNIADDDDTEYQFEVHTVDGSLASGPYDFDSIMQYGSDSFNQDPTLPSLIKLGGNGCATVNPAPNCDGNDPSTWICAQRDHLSDGDVVGLDSIYDSHVTEAAAMCRTAPDRAPLRKRADIAEVWEERNGSTSFDVHPSDGLHFGDTPYAIQATPWNVRNRYAAGDFDGDGDQDLIEASKDSNLVTLTLWRSFAGAYFPVVWALRQGGWFDSAQFVPGDFNGDGKTDLAMIWNENGGTTISVYPSTGTLFMSRVTWASGSPTWADTTRWNVGDFNHDGKDDLVAAQRVVTPFFPDRTKLTVWRANSAGNGFIQELWTAAHGGWASNTSWLTGNFDGINGTDVMAVWQNGNQASFTLYAGPASGNNFVPPVQWATDGGWDNRIRWTAADFDADRKDDVFAAWNDHGEHTLTVRRSTGTGLTQLEFARRVNAFRDGTAWCAGSFDGN